MTVLLMVVAGAIVAAGRVGSSATPPAPALPAAKVVEIYAGQRLLMQIKSRRIGHSTVSRCDWR